MPELVKGQALFYFRGGNRCVKYLHCKFPVERLSLGRGEDQILLAWRTCKLPDLQFPRQLLRQIERPPAAYRLRRPEIPAAVGVPYVSEVCADVEFVRLEIDRRPLER